VESLGHQIRRAVGRSSDEDSTPRAEKVDLKYSLDYGDGFSSSRWTVDDVRDGAVSAFQDAPNSSSLLLVEARVYPLDRVDIGEESVGYRQLLVRLGGDELRWTSFQGIFIGKQHFVPVDKNGKFKDEC